MTIQQTHAGIQPNVKNFTFFASSSGVDSRTVTLPANIQLGDLIIISENINSYSSYGAPTADWTVIGTDNAGSGAIALGTYYKIANGTESSTVVTSIDTSTTDHFWLAAVFRPDGNMFSTAITIGGHLIESTAAATVQQNSTVAGLATPLLRFFIMAQRGANNIAYNDVATPAGTLVVTQDGSGRDVLGMYYSIYNSGGTPVNTSGDLGDNGQQSLESWYMQFV